MSGPHQKLAIPKRVGGAIPQGQGGGTIYVPGQDGGGRLQPGDMGAAGFEAMAKAEAQGAEGIARLGQALDGAVQTGLNVYEKYQAAKAQSAFNEYQREEMLQRAELDKLEGENALGDDGVKARHGKWREEARARFTENLAPMARAMFLKQADLVDAKSDVWISGKENRELKVFENKASEGSILNAQNAVLQNPDDEGQMASSAGIIRAELERQGERNGWGPEYTRAKVDEATRGLNKKRISAMYDAGNLDGAEAALKVNSGHVDTGKMKPEWVEHQKRMAEKYRLPQIVHLAQLMQESGGNQNAVSKAGCIGLGQLKPETARELGFNPYDPYQNIEASAKYLRQMIDEFGTLEKGLTAYNWGPGNMRAYLKTGRGSRGQERSKESREYVDRVMGRISGGWGLAPGEAGKMQKLIDGERKRREAEAMRYQATLRHEMDLSLKDSFAAWESGVDVAPPDANTIQAIYGKNAARISGAIGRAREYCVDVNSLRSMSGADQLALLEKRKPVPGEGFAVAREYYQKLERALIHDQKERKEDAAAYLVKYDSAVKKAREALLADMSAENAKNYISSLAAAKDARGMDEKRLLPKSDAQAFARQLEGAENPAAQARSLASLFGSASPAIMSEIFEKTAPAAMIAANMDKSLDPEARMLMAAIKDKDFIQNSKPFLRARGVDFNSLQNRIAEKLEAMAMSLMSGGDDKLPFALFDSATTLAVALMEKQGLEWEDAADKACDMVALSRYEFGENANGTFYRVPKGMPNCDPDDIMDGARHFLKNLPMDEIAWEGDKTLPEERSAAIMASFLRSNAHWVTNGDESGLVLFLQNHALKFKNGKYLELSWNKLASLSKLPEKSDEAIDFYDW